MNQNRSQTFFANWGIPVAVLFAFCIFASKMGIATLDPTNYRWLLTSHSDWTPDFVAWMYFRNSDWSFPLGLFNGYSYPETVSIGLTGGIPLLAVPLKLFRSILPDTIQYYGWWILLCFSFQAIFSYKLLGAIGVKDNILKTLGACFFVLSYSMLDRIGHLNLCAHWLIVAGLYYYFSDCTIKKAVLAHSLLAFISVWVHPYLILFTVGIGAAHFLNLAYLKKISFIKMVLLAVIPLASAIIAWMLLGNHVLDSKQAVGEGFGIFSANLNTFFTPKIDTPLMSAFPRYHDGQYEGVAYLGIGVWALAFFIPFAIFKKLLVFKWRSEYTVIFLVALCYFAFAISHIVTFNQHVLLEIPFPDFIMEKLGIFRASGRYVWILQYLLMMWIVLLLAMSRLKMQWKYLILGLILILNIIDFSAVIKRNKYIATFYPPIAEYDQELWTRIMSDADGIRMYPPYTRKYNSYCDDMGFAFTAAQLKTPINTGHLARSDSRRRAEHRTEFLGQIDNKVLELDSLTLITGQEYLEDLKSVYEAGKHQLIELNDYYAFIPIWQEELLEDLSEKAENITVPMRKESFGAFAQRYEDHYFLIAVMDEASNKLSSCPEILSFFKSQNSNLDQLTFRESYVGLLGGKGEIKEQLGKFPEKEASEAVHIDTIISFLANGQEIKKHIEIYSAGMENGNKARILVDGQDHSLNDRGLNIVVLSPSGELLESTRFDTYESCHHFSDQSTLSYKLWKIN